MKRNVTVAVDDEIYRRVRAWAAQHNTSISSIVEYCILHLPTIPLAREAVEKTRQRREQGKSRGLLNYERALRHYRERDRKLREQEN